MIDSMANVILFPGITCLDLPADRLLEKAIEAELAGVVILGYTKDGEQYMASSYADGGTVIWLMEKCKKMLLEVDVPGRAPFTPSDNPMICYLCHSPWTTNHVCEGTPK